MRNFKVCYQFPSDACRSVGRRLTKIVVLAVVLSAFFTVEATAADLNGTITYKTSRMSQPAALAEALVSVYHIDSKRKTVTRTNSNGDYLFKNLIGGSYLIAVEKDGSRIYQGRVDVPRSGRRFDIKF